jgi:hypothetical protein
MKNASVRRDEDELRVRLEGMKAEVEARPEGPERSRQRVGRRERVEVRVDLVEEGLVLQVHPCLFVEICLDTDESLTPAQTDPGAGARVPSCATPRHPRLERDGVLPRPEGPERSRQRVGRRERVEVRALWKFASTLTKASRPRRLIPALALGFPAVQHRLGSASPGGSGAKSSASGSTRASRGARGFDRGGFGAKAGAGLGPMKNASVRRDEDELRVRLEGMKAEVGSAGVRLRRRRPTTQRRLHRNPPQNREPAWP